MAFEKVIRADTYQGSDKSFITISNDHISFNAMFVKQAVIDSNYRVTIYVDQEELKMGFEFHKDNKLNSFALSRASSEKKGEKRTGLFCAAQGVINKYPWVKAIAKFPLAMERRFYNPEKRTGMWVIQLCPAFEVRKARETEKIPSNSTGIYRYLTETGDIVYIGRGEINARLKSPDRKDWYFDYIEYSEINDPDMQVHWETYWIDKFKEQNNGKLPTYNKLSGIKVE